MKSFFLLLTLLLGFAVQAQSSSPYELILKNDFQCDDGRVILKETWSGWIGFGKARSEMPRINCIDYLKATFINGSPAFFALVDQIKVIERSDLFTGLTALNTEFSPADRQKATKAFEALVTGLDDSSRRAFYLVIRASEALRLTDERRRKDAADQINEFVAKEKFSDSAWGLEHNFAEGYRLGSAIFALEYHSRNRDKALATAATALTEKLLATRNVDQWLQHQYYFPERTSIFSPAPYLLLSGRTKYFEANPQLLYENAAGPALVAAMETKNLKAIKTIQSAPWIRFVPSHLGGAENFCQLVLGYALAAQDAEVREALLDSYAALSCQDGLYIEGGAYLANGIVRMSGQLKGILNDYPDKNSALVLRLLKTSPTHQLRVRAENRGAALIRACGKVEDIEPLITDPLSATIHALNAGCKPAINHFAKITAEKTDAWRLGEGLLFSPVHSNLELLPKDQVTKIIQKIEKSGKPLTNAQINILAKNHGEGVVRQYRVSQRIHGEGAQSLVLAGEKDDDEKIVRLSWRGQTLELKAEKLTATQKKFIDALRQAQTEEEVLSAVREAILTQQLSVRGLGPLAKTDLEKSLHGFLAKTNLSLETQLDSAKTLLDETLSKGGRRAAYNYSATSVYDVLTKGRMQCTSGTDFMLLHVSMSGELVNTRQVAVAVMRPQHVLPGVYDLTARKLNLVESTVEGAARSNVTAQQLPKDTQVFLADDYLLTKILGEALNSPTDVRAQALARAEKVLGIKQGEITPVDPAKLAAGANGTATRADGDSLNQNVFGFGQVNIPRGDVVRGKMDVLPQDISPEQMVSYSQPRAEATNPLSRFAPVKPAEQSGMVEHEMRFERTPEVQLAEVPDPRYSPLEHLAATAYNEQVYLNRYRAGGLRNGPSYEDIKGELEKVFKRLPEDLRKEILDDISKSPRALADWIQGDRSSVIGATESPEQRDSVVEAARQAYIANLTKEIEPVSKHNCDFYENELIRVCRQGVREGYRRYEKDEVTEQAKPTRTQILPTDGYNQLPGLMVVWGLDDGKIILRFAFEPKSPMFVIQVDRFTKEGQVSDRPTKKFLGR